MILTSIETTQIIYGYYLNDDNRHVQYQLKFDGNGQEFSCNLNKLPKELQAEFKEWISKTNAFINENVELK